MKNKILIGLGAVLVSGVTFVLALPTIVRSLGLHPTFESETYDLNGKRALVITTSHSVLHAPDEPDGPPTGVMASEFTHPYYAFLDAGMKVDMASVRGGPIPIDPPTLNSVIRTPEDERFLEDPALQAKVKDSLRIDDVDFTEYDAIFVAGGWGAAYDLGYSDVLGQKVSESGALYESATAFRDIFATHVVVDDEKRFVTGQNQNSGRETAHEMMKLVARRSGS